MIKLVKFIQKYPSQIKYGLLLFFIFSMLLAIRSYQNNLAILDAIDLVDQEKQMKIDEINFTQNFLIKYLESDYADYFLAHENSILYKNEYILRLDMNIQNKQLSGEVETGKKEDNINVKASESWKDFLSEKFKKIK